MHRSSTQIGNKITANPCHPLSRLLHVQATHIACMNAASVLLLPPLLLLLLLPPLLRLPAGALPAAQNAGAMPAAPNNDAVPQAELLQRAHPLGVRFARITDGRFDTFMPRALFWPASASAADERRMTQAISRYFSQLICVWDECSCCRAWRRVMLRRNLNVADGLHNGARGVVVRIEWAPEQEPHLYSRCAGTLPNNEGGVHVLNSCTMPARVWVRFHNARVGQRSSADMVCDIDGQRCVAIAPVQGTFDGRTADERITRTQLPLVLAFAISIHKSQSLTLPRAVIDCGATIFRGGMAYTALSRVGRLHDLILLDLEPDRLYAADKALTEHHRLCDMPPLSLSNNYGCTLIDNHDNLDDAVPPAVGQDGGADDAEPAVAQQDGEQPAMEVPADDAEVLNDDLDLQHALAPDDDVELAAEHARQELE